MMKKLILMSLVLMFVMIGSVMAVCPPAAGTDIYEASGPATLFLAIPPGFFGPGSFSGPISLVGGDSGDEDTIIHRDTQSPPSGAGIIDIEIMSLDLISPSPIRLSDGTYWYVRVKAGSSLGVTPTYGVINNPGSCTNVPSFFDIFVELDFEPVIPGPTKTLINPSSVIMATNPPLAEVPAEDITYITTSPIGLNFPGAVMNQFAFTGVLTDTTPDEIGGEGSVPEFSTVGVLLALIVVTAGLGVFVFKKKK